MADISSITLPNGEVYYFKDIYAREHSGSVSAEIDTIGSASAGTAISADDIIAWTTNIPTSFIISNEKLTITPGSAANLSYIEKSIPNITVTPKTVVTDIIGGSSGDLPDGDEVSY